MFVASALERRLRKPSSTARHKWQRLHHESLVKSCRQLIPPGEALSPRLLIAWPDDFESRRDEKILSRASEPTECFHVPEVRAVKECLPFNCEKMKRCKSQGGKIGRFITILFEHLVIATQCRKFGFYGFFPVNFQCGSWARGKRAGSLSKNRQSSLDQV